MQLRHGHKRNLSLKLLPFIVLFLITTCFLIFYFPPTYQIQVLQYNLPIIYPFLISVFCFFFFLGAFTLKSKKHGLFLGFFVVLYLIFRLNNLTHPLFLILLIALFLVVEFLFAQHNNKEQ